MPPNRKKSKIWNYFKRCDNDKQAVCKICNKNLKTSGNTSNLRGHLDKLHPNIYQEVVEEEPVQKKNKTCDSAINEKDQLEPVASTSSTATDDNIVNFGDDFTSSIGSSRTTATNINNAATQLEKKSAQTPNVKELFHNIKSITNVEGNKHKKITESIVNFIIMDHKPFSVVEGKGFVKLLKDVVPLYKIPSRETIKKRIDEKYEAMSEAFKHYITGAENYCLTYDIWTETMQNKSFVGITIHFLENSKLKSGSLGVFELFERHTAEYVQRRLYDIFNEWNISIDKVTAIVTDSTVMKVNREMFGEKKIIPCFAHTVNLIVTNSLDKSKVSTLIISKVRKIVKFVKRSVNASDELRKKQKEKGLKEGQIKKLILDVRTRWNSTFYMLERFMELYEMIGAILLFRSDAPSMITANEVGSLREIIQLLQPFERLTKEICGQHYITVSKVIPLVSCLRGMLDKYLPSFETSLSLKAEIDKEVSKRFDKLELCSSLAIATALDPRFKLLHFKDPVAKGKVINYINNYLTSNVSTSVRNESSDESEKGDNNEGDIWSYHKLLTHKNMKKNSNDITKAETEFHMFISSSVTPIKADALEMWDDLKGLFPGLYGLAKTYLPIVATSVPSERLFSEAGATITQERNRLLGTRLSKLLFLNSILKK